MSLQGQGARPDGLRDLFHLQLLLICNSTLMLTPQEDAELPQGLEFTLVHKVSQDLLVFKVSCMPYMSPEEGNT